MGTRNNKDLKGSFTIELPGGRRFSGSVLEIFLEETSPRISSPKEVSRTYKITLCDVTNLKTKRIR